MSIVPSLALSICLECPLPQAFFLTRLCPFLSTAASCPCSWWPLWSGRSNRAAGRHGGERWAWNWRLYDVCWLCPGSWIGRRQSAFCAKCSFWMLGVVPIFRSKSPCSPWIGKKRKRCITGIVQLESRISASNPTSALEINRFCVVDRGCSEDQMPVSSLLTHLTPSESFRELCHLTDEVQAIINDPLLAADSPLTLSNLVWRKETWKPSEIRTFKKQKHKSSSYLFHRCVLTLIVNCGAFSVWLCS